MLNVCVCCLVISVQWWGYSLSVPENKKSLSKKMSTLFSKQNRMAITFDPNREFSKIARLIIMIGKIYNVPVSESRIHSEN